MVETILKKGFPLHELARAAPFLILYFFRQVKKLCRYNENYVKPNGLPLKGFDFSQGMWYNNKVRLYIFIVFGKDDEMSINKNLMAFTLPTHKGRLAAAAVAAVCTVGVGAGFMAYFDYKETRAPGWHTSVSGTYYILRSNGERAVGLKMIDNASYLFDLNGIMKTGWQKYDGNNYYFDESGVMAKGIVKIDGEDFYFADESGVFKTGLQDLNGEQFYFDEHGMPGNGFTRNGENYYDKDGKRVIGWQTINGIQYYFFEDGKNKGKMAKGWQDIEVDGETYTYYFGADGHMFTGIHTIKGVTYDFGQTGNLFKGWRMVDKYYLYADEKTGAFSVGLTKIGDDTYFFDSSYYMKTGWVEVDGKKYRFDKDGKMLHDCWYEENLNKYYFTADGSAASGFIKLDYDYYFFDPETNDLQVDWYQDGDDWYYFGEDGKVWQGFYNFKGYWWFFDQATHRSARGLTKTIDFTEEQEKTIKKFKKDLENLTKFGDVKTSLGLPDLPPESASDYGEKSSEFIKKLIDFGYTEKQAKYCKTLWNTYQTSDSYEYLNAMAYTKIGDKLFGQHFFGDDHTVKTGWQTYNGIRFYFDPVTGEKVTGWKTLAGKKYYFGEFGVCAVGKVKVEGKMYDFGSKGHLPTGVTKVGSSYKYVLADNRYGMNVFGRLDGKLYYFDESGNTCKGWREVNGALYYFGTNGEILTGWQKNNSDRIYMTEEGALKNSWLNLSDGTYYFDSNARMVSGWTQINDAWYYFGSDGRLKNGWTSIDGHNYFLDHGSVVRGTFYDNEGKSFVIGAEGYVKEGWISYNNRLYYTDSSGVPVTNTQKRIDDGLYSFDTDGVATRLR